MASGRQQKKKRKPPRQLADDHAGGASAQQTSINDAAAPTAAPEAQALQSDVPAAAEAAPAKPKRKRRATASEPATGKSSNGTQSAVDGDASEAQPSPEAEEAPQAGPPTEEAEEAPQAGPPTEDAVAPAETGNAPPDASGATDADPQLTAKATDSSPPPPTEPVPTPTAESRAFAARLRALQTKMAQRFDPVAFDHAERLGLRAHKLAEQHAAAGARLWARANIYLDDYEARFSAARARALQDAKRLVRLGLLRPQQARRGLEHGQLLRLRQLARRYPTQEKRLREQVYGQWQNAVCAEAQRRGLLSPPPDQESEAEAPKGDAVELAAALYRDAVGSLEASRAIARALEQIPIEAGRYHATTVATRALKAMQTAPPYLKAQLSRLEGLALLTSYFIPQDTSDGARSDKRGNRSTSPRKSKSPRSRTATGRRTERSKAGSKGNNASTSE